MKNPYFHGWGFQVGCVVFGNTINRANKIAELKATGYRVRDMGEWAEYFK
jgi:hypothetical protein